MSQIYILGLSCYFYHIEEVIGVLEGRVQKVKVA